MRLVVVSILSMLSAPAWAQQMQTVVPTYQQWSDLGVGTVLLISHGAGRASYATTTNATAPSIAPELAFPVPVDRSQSINPGAGDHVWVSAISSLQVTVTYAASVTVGN